MILKIQLAGPEGITNFPKLLDLNSKETSDSQEILFVLFDQM